MFFSSITYAQKDFTDEIVVYFTSGVEYDKTSEQIVINSTSINSVLNKLNIDSKSLSRAFPEFKESDILKEHKDYGIIKMLDLSRVFKIRIPKRVSRDLVINELSMQSNVLFAEPTVKAVPCVEPNDEYFSNQWGLKNGATGKDIHATV